MYSKLERSAHNPIWTKGHNHQESNYVGLEADQQLSREIVFLLNIYQRQIPLFLEEEVGTVFHVHILLFHWNRIHHLVCCRLELDFSSIGILSDMFQLWFCWLQTEILVHLFQTESTDTHWMLSVVSFGSIPQWCLKEIKSFQLFWQDKKIIQSRMCSGQFKVRVSLIVAHFRPEICYWLVQKKSFSFCTKTSNGTISWLKVIEIAKFEI